MHPGLRRLRGIVGMGLVWALGGAALGAGLELIDNVAPGALPFITSVDMWPQTLALVALRRGLAFGILLAILGGRRRFEEFTVGQFTAWGALAGTILAAIGNATGGSLDIGAITIALSAFGGASTLVVARTVERRVLIGRGEAPRISAERDP